MQFQNCIFFFFLQCMKKGIDMSESRLPTIRFQQYVSNCLARNAFEQTALEKVCLSKTISKLNFICTEIIPFPSLFFPPIPTFSLPLHNFGPLPCSLPFSSFLSLPLCSLPFHSHHFPSFLFPSLPNSSLLFHFLHC